MRIVHIITRMILGGAQENTILTCEGLTNRGHEVILITGPARGPEGELLQRAHSHRYKVIVVKSLVRSINPLLDALAYRALIKHIRKIKPDIVHTHSSKAGILGRWAAWKVRKHLGDKPKIVHTIHGLPFHRYGNRFLNRLYIALERRAGQYSDALISVADAMTHQALQVRIAQQEKYTTIYSGIEINSFINRPDDVEQFRKSLSLQNEDILVTQVSRLAKLKGHEFILKAAERITDPKIHFCFIGDGRLRKKIEQRIRSSASLTGRVHLTGLLPPEKMPTVFHASDFIVHCSLHEGLARVIPQAFAAGKAVISFDIDGASEVIDDETGILVKPADVEELRDAIVKLASSPELRKQMGQKALERVKEKFDHNIMVEKIEALYNDLLNR